MTMGDETFTLSTRIERSAAAVFAWHERPGALARLNPPWERIEVLSASGGIRDGAEAVVRVRVGPFRTTWRVRHQDYVAGRQFRDVMIAGPLARWEHLHEITPAGEQACVLTDTITYRLPGGALGRAVAAGFTRRKLTRIFARRHAVTRTDLESVVTQASERGQRIVIAGASGLMGRALVPFLQTQGYEVIRLVRGRAAGANEIAWDPSRGELDATQLEGADAIVNLSGENVGDGRWTTSRRERILRSRVDATRTLIAALGKIARRPSVFVNASAVGFYGDRGDELITEASAIGHGFLPEVCLAWETHAEGAMRFGIRVALLRFGVVLSPAGGALAKMLPAFRVGLGGRFGSGRQWMSWISIDDAVGVILQALRDGRCRGAINAVAPAPVTNAELVATLSAVLRRPALLPIPAAGLRLAFGEMADEALLASTRAIPKRLQETGYRFRHPDLVTALRHVLDPSGKV